MSSVKLEEILMCPRLPSLPAVAVQLLELTSDPDVAMSEIAKLVQQDQALAAKVLKTVNSSYYGLSSPCGSIERAMGYLGLNTVKSLVLGFSLVETTGCAEQGFDHDGHWRRAILGATAARLIAGSVGGVDPEDAFTASLFQDMGMLAFFVTLKERYAKVIAGVPHSALCEKEHAELGFDHAFVGSELASCWKLPAAIVEAIRYHHNPCGCGSEHEHIARLVALGSQASACLDPDAPASAVHALEALAAGWYENPPETESLLAQVGETGKTLAKMFGQDIGEIPNIQLLMIQAQEKSVEHQLRMQRQADELSRESVTDGLTKIWNRKKFDTEIARAYDAFVTSGTNYGVLFFDADKFKRFNDTYGHAAGDAVLIELAQRTSDVVGNDGMVFRYGGEEFAVIVQGHDLDRCATLAEEVRSAIASEPFDLTSVDGVPDALRVTASIGVSGTDAGNPARLSSGEQVVHEADECVYAAKSDGRNNVKVHGRYIQEVRETGSHCVEPATPSAVTVKKPAKCSGVPKILLIEDDALAATLVISLLKRRGAVEVEWVKSGTRACTLIEQGDLNGDCAPQLILCDFSLPGCDGHEVLRVIRENASISHVPFFMLTGNNDQHMRDESLRRGATAFIHKDEFCADVNRWLGEMLEASTAKAA